MLSAVDSQTADAIFSFFKPGMIAAVNEDTSQRRWSARDKAFTLVRSVAQWLLR